MLEKNSYEKYRKKLKLLIFSCGKVKPNEIMRELFGIKGMINCPQFYLITTNSVKEIEEIWGKFYFIPTSTKENEYIVIFEYLLKNDSRYTGCVDWSKSGEELIIHSLLNKGHFLKITASDIKKYPGMITAETDIKASKRISKGHWEVLQGYFKRINVNI